VTELLVVVPVVWAIGITWAVGRLYCRPVGGLDAKDVELISRFMEHVRRVAAAERRRV